MYLEFLCYYPFNRLSMWFLCSKYMFIILTFLCSEGEHGYNNSLADMHPIFIAHGPVFKRGYLSEPFNNVDIYSLMCHILDVKPAPHDGSFDNIKHILEDGGVRILTYSVSGHSGASLKACKYKYSNLSPAS
jgi:hypothetical protein